MAIRSPRSAQGQHEKCDRAAHHKKFEDQQVEQHPAFYVGAVGEEVSEHLFLDLRAGSSRY